MIKGLGHLIRFMFGGKRPLSASAAHMVGARHHDLVEAPAASVDLLRRAMEAATGAPPQVEPERAEYTPAPVAEPQDALPTMFLHGVTALSQALKAEEVAPEPELAEEPVAEPELVPEFTAEAAEEFVEPPPAEEPAEVTGVEPEPEVTKAETKKPAKKCTPAKKKATTPKRKKADAAAQDVPLPEDEVFLSDAVIWSQCGSWREFWLPPTDANSSQRIDEFRSMAAEGKLTIWGQKDGDTAWTAIDPAHWKKNGFDPLSFLAGRENVYSEARPAKSKAKSPPPPIRYSGLKVSKAEVEALWNSDAAQAAA